MASTHINKIKSDIDNAIDILRTDDAVQVVCMNDLEGASIYLPSIQAYWNNSRDEQYFIVNNEHLFFIIQEWFGEKIGLDYLGDCICIGSVYTLVQETSDNNPFAEEFMMKIEELVDEFNYKKSIDS